MPFKANTRREMREAMSEEITPNVVIADPAKRRNIGKWLYLLLVLAGLASLFFAIFPELAFGTDIPTRVVLFVTSAVSLLGGAFGIIVTLPNVPRG